MGERRGGRPDVEKELAPMPLYHITDLSLYVLYRSIFRQVGNILLSRPIPSLLINKTAFTPLITKWDGG